MKSRLFPAFSVRLADIQITNSLVGKYAREHICPSGNRQKIELVDWMSRLNSSSEHLIFYEIECVELH